MTTVTLYGGKNAGLLAVAIFGGADEDVRNKIVEYKKSLTDAVMGKVEKVKGQGDKGF